MTKLSLLRILFVTMTLALASGTYTHCANASSPSSVFDTTTFLAQNHITSLGEYAEWAETHLTYVPDPGREIWQSPQETVQTRMGDCEDFAFLHAAVLSHFGFKPMVIAHGRGKEAHVYTVFAYNGQLYAFENTHLANTHMRGLHEMALHLAKTEGAEYLLELSFETSSFRTLFLMPSA